MKTPAEFECELLTAGVVVAFAFETAGVTTGAAAAALLFELSTPAFVTLLVALALELALVLVVALVLAWLAFALLLEVEAPANALGEAPAAPVSRPC